MPELNTVFKWHEVSKLTIGKVGGKRKRWDEIVASWKAFPSYDKWMTKDEATLAWLEAEPALIKDTALGCLSQQCKREMVFTFRAMWMKKGGIHDGVKFKRCQERK